MGVAPRGPAPSPPPGAPRPRSAVRDGAMARAGAGPPRELSLEEVLKCYEQPLNEEQAWALCFQGCRAAAAAPVAPAPLRTADIRLRADGSLRLPAPPHGEGRRRRGGRERAAPARGGTGRHRRAGLTGAYRGLRASGLAGAYRGHRGLRAAGAGHRGLAALGIIGTAGAERRGLPRFSGAYRHRHPGHRDVLAPGLSGAYRHWERGTGAYRH
uniref:KIND domain-containing protein n=1 Tax=Junco hyemalis TaxID=40217 RepID=A0A8C5NL70_JUNHY